MRSEIVISILICLLLFAVPINANSIITDLTTFDIVAGDSIDINFTIDYTDSIDATCYVTTLISPDDIGFNLTYDLAISLVPNSIIYYNIHVDTDLHLSPGTYILTTTFQIESEEPVVVRHVTHVSQGDQAEAPPINETQPPEENETIPPIIFPPPSFDGNQFDYWWVIILIIIVVGIILLFFYLKKRRQKT